MDAPVLECRDVSAGYPGAGGAAKGAAKGAPKVVLSGVSFVVGAGGRLVVIGRSGSGKSTLLRLLNRLEEPLSGEVLFEGKSVRDYEPLALRRRVALVAQTPVVFDGTVHDNLCTRPRGTPLPDASRLESLLTDVGLSADFLPRPADALSVGERQRLCLARALVSGPRALLLDEPTSALDPQSLAIVADLVLELADRHSLSIIAATHQLELARRLGGAVLLLAGGKAQRDASTEDVARFFEGR